MVSQALIGKGVANTGETTSTMQKKRSFIKFQASTGFLAKLKTHHKKHLRHPSQKQGKGKSVVSFSNRATLSPFHFLLSTSVSKNFV